ncbi:hypothetical protein BDR05DRAFT_1033158 [Suillus weaverae]|nr:hypothetical protein BDR05DRAFT_1033158 [Suillus weaverae]
MQTDRASHYEAKVEKMIGGVPRQHLIFIVVAQVVVEPKKGATMQKIDRGGFVSLFEGPCKGGQVDWVYLGLLPGGHQRLTLYEWEESSEFEMDGRQAGESFDENAVRNRRDGRTRMQRVEKKKERVRTNASMKAMTIDRRRGGYASEGGSSHWHGQWGKTLRMMDVSEGGIYERRKGPTK